MTAGLGRSFRMHTDRYSIRKICEEAGLGKLIVVRQKISRRDVELACREQAKNGGGKTVWRQLQKPNVFGSVVRREDLGAPHRVRFNTKLDLNHSAWAISN